MKIFNKMESILIRIKKIADSQMVTITALERAIGASKGVLSRALQNNTDIQAKWVQLIVDNYPQYSAEWLLTGKGEMLKNDTKTAHNPLSTAEKDAKSTTKKHIAPQLQDEFGRETGRKQAGNSQKSGVFPQNTTPIFCPSCASKEQVITALNELTQQLKARLNDKDLLIAVLNEKLSAETSEKPNKHGIKGKQSKTA